MGLGPTRGVPSGVMGRRPVQNSACSRSPPCGEEIVGHHHGQGVVASGVERQVEAAELGHAAHADPLVEAGDGHLVGFVQHCAARRPGGVRHRQGEGVALDRVDGELYPEGAQKPVP
jgi:hypothetical protein